MTKNTRLFLSVALVAAVMNVAGCSKEDPKMPTQNTSDYRQIALVFVSSMAARDYVKAYAITTEEYREKTSVEQLRSAFEAIVPTDWGTAGPIEVGQTMTSWPGKRHSDLGWAYVSIGGDVYSEAVTVVVRSENREARIREVEFGRP